MMKRRCGKIGYATKVDALISMAHQEVAVTMGGRMSKGMAPGRAYRCPDCHRWHLTSR